MAAYTGENVVFSVQNLIAGIPGSPGSGGTLWDQEWSSDPVNFPVENILSTDLSKRWQSDLAGGLYARWYLSLSGTNEVPLPFQLFATTGHNLNPGGFWRVVGQTVSGGSGEGVLRDRQPSSVVAGYTNVTGDGGGAPNTSEVSSDNGSYHKFTGSGTIEYDFATWTNTVSGDQYGFVELHYLWDGTASGDVTVALYDSTTKIRDMGVIRGDSSISIADDLQYIFFTFDPAEVTIANLRVRVSGQDNFWIDSVHVAIQESGGSPDFDTGALDLFDTFSQLQFGGPTFKDFGSAGINWTSVHIEDTVLSEPFRLDFSWINAEPEADGVTSGGDNYWFNGYELAHISNLWCGPIMTPPLNMEYGFTTGMTDTSEVIELDDGHTAVRRNRRKRTCNMSFKHLTPEFAHQNFTLWMDMYLGQSQPFILVPEPQRSGVQSIQNIMARQEGIPTQSMPYFDRVQRKHSYVEW